MTTTEPMNVTTPSDREVLVTRAFDAPRRLVFDCLSKPELVKQWLLGPPGWTGMTKGMTASFDRLAELLPSLPTGEVE